MAQYRIEHGRRRSFWSPATRITLIIVVLAILVGARSIASYAIEIEWWKELGQFNTWLSMLYYGIAPVAAGHPAGIRRALGLPRPRAEVRRTRGWASTKSMRASPRSALLLLCDGLSPPAAIDTWTVVRFAGSRGLPAAASAWHDAVFDQPLSFYLFDLAVLFAAARLRAGAGDRLHPGLLGGGARLAIALQLPELREAREWIPASSGWKAAWNRASCAARRWCCCWRCASRFYLGRYEMVYNEHGSFLVGIDYVDQNIGLPLQWLVIFACLGGRRVRLDGPLVPGRPDGARAGGRFRRPARWFARCTCGPTRFRSQRPYIQTHIHATRSAFGLEQRVQGSRIQGAPRGAHRRRREHKDLLDNVRLWDWRAFHDTVTQIQALRPYYVFADTDVDRYTIDGQYRQVLLTPRELESRQLPDARANWINPAFIYTHGYGLVLAPVSQITPTACPCC